MNIRFNIFMQYMHPRDLICKFYVHFSPSLYIGVSCFSLKSLHAKSQSFRLNNLLCYGILRWSHREVITAHVIFNQRLQIIIRHACYVTCESLPKVECDTIIIWRQVDAPHSRPTLACPKYTHLQTN